MTDYERHQIITRMANERYEPADYAALMAEGQLEGFTDEADGPDRSYGYANWVGYLPSCQRAVWVSNGDPVWFDATSLDDAVEQVRSGAELIN